MKSCYDTYDRQTNKLYRDNRGPLMDLRLTRIMEYFFGLMENVKSIAILLGRHRN